MSRQRQPSVHVGTSIASTPPSSTPIQFTPVILEATLRTNIQTPISGACTDFSGMIAVENVMNARILKFGVQN